MDYYKQEEYYSRMYHTAEIRLSRWNEVTLGFHYLIRWNKWKIKVLEMDLLECIFKLRGINRFEPMFFGEARLARQDFKNIPYFTWRDNFPSVFVNLFLQFIKFYSVLSD